MHTVTRLSAALVVSALPIASLALSAQAPEMQAITTEAKPRPRIGEASQSQQIQQLQQALGQKTLELGQCNAERGSLQTIQARLIAGQLVAVDDARKAFIATFEAANAGQTLNPETFAIIMKAKQEKQEGGK